MNNYRKLSPLYLSLLFFLFSLSVYGETYRVVRGDTLYSIARTYAVSVKDLMALNGIENPSSLSVGMDLIIPGTEERAPASFYTVAKGDTYYSISRKLCMDMNDLLQLNHLTVNDVLSIGQKLAIGSSAVQPRAPVETPADTGTVAAPPEQPEPTPKRTTETVPAAIPALTFGKTGRDAEKPEWPVAGHLYSVDGDFEGVMIESAPSSYVEAVADGEVVWAGPYWEFGEIVLIENEGFIYFYGGNSDIFVNVGQKVTVGTRVGRLDNVDGRGNLYFTVFKEGKVIDLAMAGN